MLDILRQARTQVAASSQSGSARPIGNAPKPDMTQKPKSFVFPLQAKADADRRKAEVAEARAGKAKETPTSVSSEQSQERFADQKSIIHIDRMNQPSSWAEDTSLEFSAEDEIRLTRLRKAADAREEEERLEKQKQASIATLRAERQAQQQKAAQAGSKPSG